jgi:hypothetical protein
MSTAALEEGIKQHQDDEEHKGTLNEWAKRYKLEKRQGLWWKGAALVVLNPETVQKELLEWYHDAPTAGHPGMAKTYDAITRSYWWPDIRKFVQEYVKGCATCQANKIITRRNAPPLNPILPQEGAKPFQTIAMDFIVKLPKSQGIRLHLNNHGS